MLLQAADDFGISLADSVLVGDAITDIEAGAAAGIRRLVRVTDREPEGPKRRRRTRPWRTCKLRFA